MSSNRFLNAQLSRFEQNKKPLLSKKVKLEAKIAVLQQELDTLDTQIAAVDKVKQLFIENNPIVAENTETAAPQPVVEEIPESDPIQSNGDPANVDHIGNHEITEDVGQINGEQVADNNWGQQ